MEVESIIVNSDKKVMQICAYSSKGVSKVNASSAGDDTGAWLQCDGAAERHPRCASCRSRRLSSRLSRMPPFVVVVVVVVLRSFDLS